MTDIEENNSLVGTPEIKSIPVRICGLFNCRIKQASLKLGELHRLAAVFLSVVSICACSVLFMRKPVPKFGINMRWTSVMALFITTIMYVLKFTNIYMGGWGAADSRFWCDVRIMYVRGFNTVRTIFDWLSASFLFSLLIISMGLESSLLFILLLVMIATWQAGLAENQNQYSIKFQDKFTDNNGVLCVETLHCYQQQHAVEKVMWVPFIIANVIKTYTLTCMIFYSTSFVQDFIFVAPIIILITIRVYLLPCFLDFVYYKQMITFCTLEVYRILSDCIVLPLIVLFTLV